MENEENTLLVIKMDGRTTSVEMEGSGQTVQEMLEAFYGAMVGQTFLPCTVIRGMAEFAEEHEAFSIPSGCDKEGE